MLKIEAGRPEDASAVESLAAEVFAAYGDYGQIIPRFYSTQGVHPFVARDAGELIGFVLLGFLPWTGGAAGKDWWVGDLLAIAVAPDRQGRGIGRRLMGEVDRLVSEMADWRDLKEIQLTCAADNEGGLAFFDRLGYRVVERNHGNYSNGQSAWRLARTLEPSPTKDSPDAGA
jgi:ribosomal protein S18 acetylase RimI-like enzyme